MKKLLLSCFLALGIGASAQFVQGFDSSTTLPTGWSIINGGDPNAFLIGTVPSGGTVTTAQSGTNVARISYNAAAHDDYLVTPAITVQAGVNDRISFYVASFSSTFTESYDVRVSTAATAAAFATATVVKPSSKAPAAWTKYTIDLSAYVGQTIYVGFHATDTDQWYLMFDTIVNDAAPTTVPGCATGVTPAAGATDVTVRPSFTWPDVAGASGYKLYLSSAPGANDLINGAAVTSGATLGNNPALAANTTYYLKVVPTNDIGDAVGCVETSFTTGANFYAPYCGPFISSTPTQMAPIKSVKLGTTAYTSDAGVTTIGTYPAGENFVSSIFEFTNVTTTIPLEVQGIGLGTNGFAAAVFIDWNNDGDFLDAGESYFNTTATMLRSTTLTNGVIVLNGNLAVPAGVTVGDKRLRVKYNFSGTTINSPLTTACTDLTNGQVEDYTLRITMDPSLATSSVTKNAVSVYPNPFHDVLKISDVKGVASITITDVSGRTVKNMKPSTELNLSSLNAGLYIVTLHMEDGSVKTVKAIKK